MVNNLCEIKMKSYDVDYIDIHIMDFLIYSYACGMTSYEIIDNDKYMLFDESKIVNSIFLKKVNIKNRIKEMIEKGFFESENKIVGKKTQLFIKPTEFCLYIRDTRDISYGDFLKENYQDDKKVKKGEVRHLYPNCEYVKFTESELQKLKEEFPYDYEMRIENCENYCKSKGKSYTNYLATIKNWSRKEKNKRPNTVRDFSKISF